MVAFGEQTIPSGITALLIATDAGLGRDLRRDLPRRAAAAAGRRRDRRRLRRASRSSSARRPSAATGALDPVGLAAILLSPIAWSTGSLFASHRASLPSRPLVATGAPDARSAGSSSRSMALLTGELGRLRPRPRSRAIRSLAFVYLTVVGSLVAFTVYGWLLRVAPLPLVATYAYVNPVVAVILGAIVLSEPIDARTVVAGAVIVVAVALIVTARGRMAAPRDARRPPLATRGRRRPATARPRRRLADALIRRSGAPSPGPATARSGAAGPRDSRGRSRPGSACGAGSCPRR